SVDIRTGGGVDLLSGRRGIGSLHAPWRTQLYSEEMPVMSNLDRWLCGAKSWLRLGVVTFIAGILLLRANDLSAQALTDSNGYRALVRLFQQWREFEHPVMKNNVPDYSASAMAAKAAALNGWRKQLNAIDPKSWPIEQQNDYKLVEAEMKGLDFNLRVL